jgi:hypothetical protein
MSGMGGCSRIKYFVGVFDDKLDGVVPRVGVRDFTLDIGVSHDGGCEDHCNVVRGHLRYVSC